VACEISAKCILTKGKCSEFKKELFSSLSLTFVHFGLKYIKDIKKIEMIYIMFRHKFEIQWEYGICDMRFSKFEIFKSSTR